MARLELGDIDWRAGQIILRGKASRQEGMPLPADVGRGAGRLPDAGAAADANPRRCSWPPRLRCGPSAPGLVGDVTHRACDRAGLPRSARTGCGTRWRPRCCGGAPRSSTSSQVLRHRDLATTAIYAKVDYRRAAAQSPGPGRERSDERPGRRGRATTCGCATVSATNWPNTTGCCRGSSPYLDAAGLPTVTVAAALAWAQRPDVDPASSVAPRRMTIARGFARYMAGIDPRTEVPPPGLISGRAAGVRRSSTAPTTSPC